MNYHLKFEATGDCGEDQYVAHGDGNTLIQALASLERDLMGVYGGEAAFEKHCCFLNRDIVSLVDDLDEVGGVFECSDFSDPEGAFTITRI